MTLYFIGTRQICLANCEWCEENCACAAAATLANRSLKQRSCYNHKWLSDAESTDYSLLLMILGGEGEENCSPDSNISDTISFSIRLKELRDSELDVRLLISSSKHRVSKFTHHRSGGLRAQGLNSAVWKERESCDCFALCWAVWMWGMPGLQCILLSNFLH